MQIVKMQIVTDNEKEQYFFFANLDAKRLGAFTSKAYAMLNGQDEETFDYEGQKHLPKSILLNRIIVYLRDEFYHYYKDQIELAETVTYNFYEKMEG